MRPHYHLTAPYGLINDPNGFIKYKDEYYIFFQWNPEGLVHKNKHWGLMKTKNFIDFSEATIALKPDSWFDKDGCYSGTSRIIDDTLYLIYTGNVKEKNSRKSYQCVARLEEDGTFTKLGPILEVIPKGYTGHFRDPFYFNRNNKDYFLIGAQSNSLTGKALVYNWDNFQDPQLVGEIKLDKELDAYMWECPNLWQGNQDVLIFSPQGIPKEKYRYQNLYHSVAAIGKLEMDSLKFQSESIAELDYGFDFYAPQLLGEENLLIGWMGLPEDEDLHLSISDNWIHALTMVRVLSINEKNRLIQKPHPFYSNLRKKKIELKENQKAYNDIGEINVSFDLSKGSEFELKLMASDNAFTSLSFKDDVLILNRMHSDGLKGVRYLKLNPSDKLKLQIFLDKSTVEIFVNDGEKVMSARVFNRDSSVYFQLQDLKNIITEEYNFYEYEG